MIKSVIPRDQRIAETLHVRNALIRQRFRHTTGRIVRFKGEAVLVADIAQRAHDIVPVDDSVEGRDVIVDAAVVVVDIPGSGRG